MVDPQLEAFCRIRGVADCRGDVFRRTQRYLQEEIDPQLAELATLRAEKADLTQQLEALRARVTAQQTAQHDAKPATARQGKASATEKVPA